MRIYLVLPFLLLAPAFVSAQAVDKEDARIFHLDTKPAVERSGDDIFNDVKIGIILPQGMFAQPLSDPGNNVYDFTGMMVPFKGMGGMGAKPGYNIQYEGFSAIGKPHSGPELTAHFGVQYGFDFGYMPLNWDNISWGNYNMTVGTSPFLYGGFKVGPAFYLNPTKDMGLGIYFLVDPFATVPGGANASYNYTDASGNKTIATYDIQDSSTIHFSIDYSAGINFYYKAFILGFEYNWIHTKYNGSITEDETDTKSNGSVTEPNTHYSFGSVLQTNVIKLTFGIRLGYGGKGRRENGEN
jgi:hypothetical protein